MKLYSYLVILLLCAFIFSGCTAAVNRYGASVENVELLRSMQGTSKVKVNAFTSDKLHKSINCRGTITINTPDGKPFEEFIRDAFISELKLAGIYANDSTIAINGHFEKLDASSVTGNAKWMFKIIISAEGRESFSVDSEYPFSASFLGDRACQEVPQAFGPAVQQLINDIVNHPKFSAMIR